MKRSVAFGAILAATILAALVGLRLTKNAGGEPSGLENRAEASYGFQGQRLAKTVSRTPIGDEAVLQEDIQLPEVALAPTFRRPDVRIVESALIRKSATELTRAILLQTAKSLIRKEETFGRVDASADWMLVGSTYMKGDAFNFEYDQSLVDPIRLEEFLADESVSISWKSRLSDYVQLKIASPSIERFDRVFARANQLFHAVVVEPDFINFTSEVPNDYNPSKLWNLDQVSAADAWSLETGADDTVIAIIDTGAEMTHSDLVDNFWVNAAEIPDNGIDDDGNDFVDDVNGWDFSGDDNDPTDTEGHGTHVAGIAAARGNNSLGMTGIAWRSKAMILKVGDEDGLSNQAIAEALRYVRMMKQRGVNIVTTNNSYGGDGFSRSMRDVIQGQQDAGILFVAAAGNEGNDIDGSVGQYPAGYDVDTIISVANSTQSDSLVSSSNYGLQSVDLAAPGAAIYSTIPGNSYGYMSGTSMASPLVAGAVALVASHEPEFSWSEIKNRILDTVDEVPWLEGKVLTGGRLNAFAAVDSEFLDFDISIQNHTGSLVFLPDSNYPVEFVVNIPDGIVLSAEIVDGGVSEIVVDGDRVSCQFFSDGVYTIRLNASASGNVKSVDRTVFVGETGDVTDGLLHYYSFEGTGSNVQDLAGSGNGVLNNATIENGGLGKSARFTGTASNMQFESESSGQITITALANADRITQNGHPRIVNTPDYYLYVSSEDGIDTPDGNRNVFKFYSNRIDGDYGVWNTVPDSVVVGEWVHVAATYDSRSLSYNPLIYIDGESRAVRTQVAPTGTQSVNGGVAYVGDRDDAERTWDGLIDEVRIYGRILSSKEIAIVSSQYFKQRWNGYRIRKIASADGLSMTFIYENDDGESPDARYEWSLVDAVGSGEIIDNGGSSIVLNASALKSGVVQLVVSDGAASEYLYYSISDDSESPQAGIYRSGSGDGTIVWFEVSESLDSGYLSVYDESSGYSRFRTPVAIDVRGVVSAVDNVGGTLAGVVGVDFSGRIEGTDIVLEAEYLGPSTGVFLFSGEYSGGILGRADAYIDMLVNDLGDCLLVRRGGRDEVILGTVSEDGVFSGGDVYSGDFSVDGNSFSGSLASDDGEQPFFLMKAGVASRSEFVNLSTRSEVQAGERLLIGGFVIPEGENRNILIRAAGPSLGSQDVENRLMNPQVEIVSGSEIVESNTDWELSGSEPEKVFSTVGAFAFAEDSVDASLALNLAPGAYTALVSSEVEGDSGEALVEIYDIDRGAKKALANVSTRGYVSARDAFLIGGFVIAGDQPKQVLIRGVGPGLMDQGVSDYLRDPMIELVRGSEILTSNDDWMGGSSVSSSSSVSYRSFELIEAMSDAVGAFRLNENSDDAAMVVWLEPGAYTVLVSGKYGDDGVALVEIYDLP